MSIAAVAPRAVIGSPAARRRDRRWLGVTVVLVTLAMAWELAKWLGGDPWRIHGDLLGMRLDYEHVPPFRWRFATDLSLPHLWSIVGAFGQISAQTGQPLLLVLVDSAIYTLRTALLGFAVGVGLGLGLSILFVHSRLLERAVVPWVVASQTVPIIAIAPVVVIAFGASWQSVAIIATYLTFFPVTIAMIRGLRAFDPRAGELMRSYAASTRDVLWKLRLPASVPYLFSALRVAAAGSIVGTVIGELPSGIPFGLGSKILNFNQYYTTSPERLWAVIIATVFTGLVFVGLVRLAEAYLTRGRYRPLEVVV
ncbi:MAG TPA: ABC transporter permease [Candidatus Limnocylindrales bacterium]|nr:ABC transporter permease [Candidatus Limnocylindrales bacterium]